MGLFSRLFHREEQEDRADPSEYAGMRMEVMDENGAILFIARASVAWDGELELQPLNVPHLPPYADNIPVLLRGYDDEEKLAVHMQGTIVSRGKGLWLVEDFQVTGKDNERAFYRFATNANGEVTPMKQWGLNSSSCRLLNVSAGGVCLWSDAEFLPGERILLKNELFDEWGIKPLICIVRRVTKRRFGYEYGCKYSSLPPATEEKITRIIMDMQRKNRREQEFRQTGSNEG